MAINFPATNGQPTDGTFTYSAAGITYSWNGESWEAAGAGASAVDLTVFEVGADAAASGGGGISYDQNTGTFTYTPPDLSGYISSVASLNDIGDVTITNVAAGNAITWSDVDSSWVNVPIDTWLPKIGGTVTGIAAFENNVTIKGTTRLEGRVDFYDDSTPNKKYFEYLSGAIDQVTADQSDPRVFLGYSQYLGTEIQYLDTAYDAAAEAFVEPNPGFRWLYKDSEFGLLGRAKTLAHFGDNGCQLYHEDTKRLETTATGVNVVGDLTVNGVTHYSRTTVQTGILTLSNGGIANVDLTAPPSFLLLKIDTTAAAWVTLYASSTARTDDANRDITVDPTPGDGVLAEVVTTGNATQLITPATICFNANGNNTTYAKIVNRSGATTNLQVTLHYVQLEA